MYVSHNRDMLNYFDRVWKECKPWKVWDMAISLSAVWHLNILMNDHHHHWIIQWKICSIINKLTSLDISIDQQLCDILMTYILMIYWWYIDPGRFFLAMVAIVPWNTVVSSSDLRITISHSVSRLDTGQGWKKVICKNHNELFKKYQSVWPGWTCNRFKGFKKKTRQEIFDYVNILYIVWQIVLKCYYKCFLSLTAFT